MLWQSYGITPSSVISCHLLTYNFTLGCLWCQWVFLWFHASICLDIRLSVCPSQKILPLYLTLQGFHILAWNLVGWCTVWWSRLLSKIAILSKCLPVPWNFHISWVTLMVAGSNTGLSRTQYDHITIILGVWPFWLTPSFFRSIAFWWACS